MALDVGTLLGAMTTAGQGLANGLWTQIQTSAIPELEKIAAQIVAIEQNQSDYTPDGAKALLDMQLHATTAVIVGATSMAMEDVQVAINQILDGVKAMVNTAVGFALIA